MRGYKYKINSKIFVPYPDSDNLTDAAEAEYFRIVGYGVNPHTYIIYDDISNKKRAVYLGPKYNQWFKNRITQALDLNERINKELEIEDRKKKPAKSVKRKPKKVVKKCKCN
jgi:hypothetical protein